MQIITPQSFFYRSAQKKNQGENNRNNFLDKGFEPDWKITNRNLRSKVVIILLSYYWMQINFSFIHLLNILLSNSNYCQKKF